MPEHVPDRPAPPDGAARDASDAPDAAADVGSTDGGGRDDGTRRDGSGGEGTRRGPRHDGPPELTERESEILAFERDWVARSAGERPGAKEAAVRARFGLSATRYHQALGALLDAPAALASDPLTVLRLRRLRERRRAARGSRRVLGPPGAGSETA